MSRTASKYPYGKSIPRSKESIAAENAKYDAEMKRYQANAAFLAKVAEGELASQKALYEQAQAKKAAQKYPFEGQTFDSMSYTFQPQLSTPSWGAR